MDRKTVIQLASEQGDFSESKYGCAFIISAQPEDTFNIFNFANAIEQRTLERISSQHLDAAIKYSELVQALTDPENQPSQFNTVTVEYMEARIAETTQRTLERAAQKCDALAGEFHAHAADCAAAIRALGEKA